MEIYKFSMKTSFERNIHIYIYFFVTYLYSPYLYSHVTLVLYLPLTPLTLLSLQFRPLLYYVTSILKFLFCI